MTIKGHKIIDFMTILVLIPFGLCAGFLLLLGKCLGLSYKQISVIFNLHLQGWLLLFSGALPLLAGAWNFCQSPSWVAAIIVLLTLSYFSIYIVFFIWLLRHYHMPMNYAFDLCVSDLRVVASKWHLSYHAVNLIIFIFWWLAVVSLNIFVAYHLFNFVIL